MGGMSRRNFMQTSAAGLLTMAPQLRSDQTRAQDTVTGGEDLCFMPATVVAAAIRAKKVSPVEVINAVYARIP